LYRVILTDILIVIVNSDLQRELKGSRAFMSEDERLRIVEALSTVDFALISSDEDKTQCKTLGELLMVVIKPTHPFQKQKHVSF